jgi:hypothetical protein
MANVRASMADDELALVADSSSCCSLAFKGLPFALTMLARQFPGACSNAVLASLLLGLERRRIAHPKAQDYAIMADYIRDLRPAKWGLLKKS